MGEDEYDEFEVEDVEDDGEPDTTYVTVIPEKGSPWGVLAATLGLLKNSAEAFRVFFFQLQLLAENRFAWQSERQRFFEEAGPQIERLTALEIAEVKDATAE